MVSWCLDTQISSKQTFTKHEFTCCTQFHIQNFQTEICLPSWSGDRDPRELGIIITLNRFLYTERMIRPCEQQHPHSSAAWPSSSSIAARFTLSLSYRSAHTTTSHRILQAKSPTRQRWVSLLEGWTTNWALDPPLGELVKQQRPVLWDLAAVAEGCCHRPQCSWKINTSWHHQLIRD